MMWIFVTGFCLLGVAAIFLLFADQAPTFPRKMFWICMAAGAFAFAASALRAVGV